MGQTIFQARVTAMLSAPPLEEPAELNCAACVSREITSASTIYDVTEIVALLAGRKEVRADTKQGEHLPNTLTYKAFIYRK